MANYKAIFIGTGMICAGLEPTHCSMILMLHFTML